MSLTWVIIGSLVQVMLAMFLFMLVGFSASSIVNSNSLSKLQMGVLNLSLYALPATCMLSAAMVIYYYCVGASARAYWWYLLPMLLAAVYLVYASLLNGRS